MENLEWSRGVKRSKKNSSPNDRISALPEPLISHILSLLPTKFAVATSLLSTRWKFLWNSITNLNFDDERGRYGYRRTIKVANMRRQNFTRFVNRVLLLLNPPCTQRFRLKCHHDYCDPFYLYPWICAAIGRTIQELDIFLILEKPMDLPLSCSYSRMLAVLKLKGDIHFNIPSLASICFPSLETLRLSETTITIASDSFVGFPSLKVLHLDCVKYANEESVHKLFGSCPVLDNLVMKKIDWDNVLRLTICITSLRSLTIYLWSSDDRAYTIQIDTPALQHLNVEGKLIMCEYVAGTKLSSLLEAKVKIYFAETLQIDANSYSIKIFKFIEGLSKVKFLSISGGTLKAVRFASSNISYDFRNLTRLELAKDNCSDWCVVIKRLLESMDNLEHLLMDGNYCRGSHGAWWTEPLHVPMCLVSRVTTISFTFMVGYCHDELEMMRYFLKNAKVLELLTLRSAFQSSDKKVELVQKISMFPRGSQTCQVAFN